DGPRSAGLGLAATRLDMVKSRPLRWLVPNILPLGKLVMFAGDGGLGKSLVTLGLTADLTRGRPCLGLDYPDPVRGEVLLISCEDDLADTIAPRLDAACADRSKVWHVDGIRTAQGKLAPFSLAHYEQMERYLEDYPDIRLVIIDPAGAYIGKAGVDDHKDSELRALL